MTRSALDQAFDHHSWANLRLADACLALSDDHLATTVPGTFGSILETWRHIVGADSYYLFRLGAHDAPIEDDEEAALTMAGCRDLAQRQAEMWRAVLAAEPDPEEIVIVRRDDGSETHAPKGIRLAQVLHHGTDHRSQICTALTSLGIEPPDIDVWAFGFDTGRVTEMPSTA